MVYSLRCSSIVAKYGSLCPNPARYRVTWKSASTGTAGDFVVCGRHLHPWRLKKRRGEVEIVRLTLGERLVGEDR